MVALAKLLAATMFMVAILYLWLLSGHPDLLNVVHNLPSTFDERISILGATIHLWITLSYCLTLIFAFSYKVPEIRDFLIRRCSTLFSRRADR